jgi:hypothetical protein
LCIIQFNFRRSRWIRTGFWGAEKNTRRIQSIWAPSSSQQFDRQQWPKPGWKWVKAPNPILWKAKSLNSLILIWI